MPSVSSYSFFLFRYCFLKSLLPLPCIMSTQPTNSTIYMTSKLNMVVGNETSVEFLFLENTCTAIASATVDVTGYVTNYDSQSRYLGHMMRQ